ncbi:nuclease [Leptolyngbya sp. BL0902]|uniref:exonuclease subunit SbcD n=1 Tax=Leptolyngbya sp. BL0902 TaxID=1115757 RepID=UPI0018E83098|nr:exonuclease subunit SbcD [Leptolyngbya sp. BL0902]QQE66483.1 nuclease [Leptolyngbya sp. BL0902]
MITVLHLSDIHLGSGLSHGRINPETGLNTRLEDFIAALTRCMDRALAEPVDLVLFGGDAFPDATPPPLVQQALAQQFCRLSAAGIPTVLLVGNHDQHAQGLGGASLSIYRTLGVPGVVVGDRLETHRLVTRQGPVQVVTLPWITRSTLLTRPETDGLSMAQVNELLLDRLRVALEGEIRSLDPALPTVLLAHAMVDTARYGGERFLAAGRGLTIPMALLARLCFDYVALGHVHRHQILCHQPLMIYPGSIERVDFSEESEDKGYVLVHLQRGGTTAEFCPLPVRPFRTIEVDLTAATAPQETLLQAIAATEITDAVVRCLYSLRADQVDQIDSAALVATLASAHTYTVQAHVEAPVHRHRLPDLSPDSTLDPLTALKTYLDSRPEVADLKETLITAATLLLESADDLTLDLPGELDRHDWDNNLPDPAAPPDDSAPPATQQLRLL